VAKNWWGRTGYGIGLVASILGILAFVFIFWQPWLDTEPARAFSPDPARSFVTVANKKGEALWSTQTFKGVVQNAIVAKSNGTTKIVVGIEGDGEDTGNLFVYDQNGHPTATIDTLASFKSLYPRVYDQSSPIGAHRQRFTVRSFLVEDLLPSRGSEVVVSVHDVTWYLSSLMVFNLQGQMLGAFVHPGHIEQFRVGRFGQDWKIVVTAINNDLTPAVPDGDGYAHSVFLLDPNKLAGEAPPHAITGLPGTQEWYMIVAPKGYSATEIQIGKKDSDEINDLTLGISCGLYLTFVNGSDTLGIKERADNYTCPPQLRVRQLNQDASRIVNTYSGF